MWASPSVSVRTTCSWPPSAARLWFGLHPPSPAHRPLHGKEEVGGEGGREEERKGGMTVHKRVPRLYNTQMEGTHVNVLNYYTNSGCWAGKGTELTDVLTICQPPLPVVRSFTDDCRGRGRGVQG